jgi:hypothetical protein
MLIVLLSFHLFFDTIFKFFNISLFYFILSIVQESIVIMKKFDLKKRLFLECCLLVLICASLAPEYLDGFHPYLVVKNLFYHRSIPGEYERSSSKNFGSSQGPRSTKCDFLKNGCSVYD